MPLFMDLHINSSSEISIEELVEIHRSDLAVQEKYGVEFKSMWVNKEKGMVFCLVEGPDKESCTRVHQEAHGDQGCNIVEVNPGDFNKFLADSAPNEYDIAESENGKMDTGYRTILRFDAPVQPGKKGLDNQQIVQIIKKNKGTLLIEPQKGIKAVFVHPSNAFFIAIQIKNLLDKNFGHVDYKMAIVSGRPVEEKNNRFFGYASDLSEKIIKSAPARHIMSTQLTYDLLYQEYGYDHAVLEDIRVLSKADEALVLQLIDTIEKHFSDPEFTATQLAQLMGLSRSRLFRKVKELTGLSPIELIRELRLYEAMQQLNENSQQVTQIAYNSGYSNPSYFSKIFMDRYGILPSDYARHLKETPE